MRRTVRRGSALILVLIMTLSLAALATSAIYMTGSSGLLSRFHDKERDLTFAVESALELGRARLQRDTTLALYDTGYKQILTNQAVYTSSGVALTGVTVNLYAGYTGDTSGMYVPYVTLLATVNDAGGLRMARRMDLQAQSFARYTLFANSLASGTIGAGENFPGRVHVNSNFYGSSSGSPNPVFSDTVSAAGTISGSGQWADTISAAAGATVVPFPTTSTSLWPSATAVATRFQALSTAGNVSVTPASGTLTSGNSYSSADLSGNNCGYSCNATFGSRLEFLAYDVNNSGTIDSTEGFFRLFNLVSDRFGWRADTIRLATNFPGAATTQVPDTTQVWLNQCGAFYTIGGRREFFPVAMHSVTWVQTRIQSSTYPTVSLGQANAMGAGNRTAYRTIMQQPTSRCFPFGSPYLMNVERFTTGAACTQAFSFPLPGAVAYTFGSSPACGASDLHGGQDTTFTARVFDCIVDPAGAGRCRHYASPPPGNFDDALELGRWQAYGGTSSLPADLAPTRQTVERPYLFPISTAYNPNYRGVIYSSGRLFLSGIVRGRATLYVNGPVSLIDDVTYDQPPADTANLCRNNFGLIAKDSIMVADNAINRPHVYSTSAVAGTDTSMQGGNRDFIFHGIAMALGGSISAFNAAGSLRTSTVYTCPTGSSFTAAGGCMQVVGGTIMTTYVAPYNSSVANSGLRPLRELDPCQMENRRPPYFPIARTRVRPLKSFAVDARQVKTAALITAYFNRLRGTRAAP